MSQQDSALNTDARPLRWGVLGAARIATAKVIPAMQRSAHGRVVAIASRDLTRARHAAAELGIDRSYGSYEELLSDSDVDIIYNPRIERILGFGAALETVLWEELDPA